MSYGDDMDEDELLQIALREQAERDVNYRRPPSASSKPVLNHVQLPTLRSKDRPHQRSRHGTAPQPPPPPAAAAASKGKEQGAGRRSAAEEDDDSEVEMLSISSGDEESPAKDRGFVGGAGRGRARPRRGGRDEASDRGWDGEEPDSWKRVDEAEVGMLSSFLLFVFFF